MAGVMMHALVLALGLILPLGVQNVFIFQQGIVQRRWRAVLPVVITAGLCDTLLISVAVGGVSVLVLGLPAVKLVLMEAGVVFLLYMGTVTWKSATVRASAEAVIEHKQNDRAEHAATARMPMNAKRQIGFTLSVSLLNPHALLDTIGVIGTSSLRYEAAERWAFTCTCIVVSWLWFTILAAAGMTIGRLDTTGRWLRWLNRSSAVLIWGIALYLLVGLYGEIRLWL
ncbi:LysE/ArgO family amino acid transporter [Paenibacillus campi]|uniref:LysE/ArgO family amino acid transporter n=1 Tax=Paenibacillus campi TaxID=3106031 RepID=UPI002AFDF582|nr:LysE/ArgO family amino acid transporter [Paenibacillus sp. SGZ-1014]